MTQLTQARKGIITPEMERVAQREHIDSKFICEQVAAGRFVIPANRLHLAGVGEGSARLDPCGIGFGLTTKINANIGASPITGCADTELVKLDLAVKFGADAVMDLSTGSGPEETRGKIVRHSTVPVGTVPLYSMILDKDIIDLTEADILSAIEAQARQGVDFFTIHAGVLKSHLPAASRRVLGICSRGGALLGKWMTHHNRENPMYTLFDEISAIMAEYDVCYSLGDGLRPGCLADASDEAQMAELDTLGELVERARNAGVQVMVEGPGHVPYDQIEMNMRRQQELCDGAPFYVLGPIVSDVFPGYDHIVSAIGATAAATHGASFLCYVTPAEHLALPNADDVKQGCIAYKIAAHAADIALKRPGARDWDDAMARARANFDWKEQFRLAFDPEKAREIRTRDSDIETDDDYCSMCGRDWCAVRISKEICEEQ